MAFVEKNLDNNDYSVELFSDDMCMSRMNLYRKLQSITGQKPTEFIRSIRLKKAARLLTDTDLSIVEISEKVGFATPVISANVLKKCSEYFLLNIINKICKVDEYNYIKHLLQICQHRF